VDRDQVLTILGELIEICQNSERDHRSAASCTTEENLTAHFLFHDYALQRAQFVRKLQEEMHFLGYTPGHSACQPVLDVEASPGDTFCAPSSHTLLDECRRVEAMAEKRYESALRSGLPTYLHDIIKNQYMHIREARHRIHKLEPDIVTAS
jgi:uncharacterized protein (TIGR02284 family)